MMLADLLERYSPVELLPAGPRVSQWLDAAARRRILERHGLRDIGYATVGRWQLGVRGTMGVEDASLDVLYQSTVLDLLPGSDMDLTTATSGELGSEGSSSSEGSGTTSSGSRSRATHSEYPMTRLTRSGEYASAGDDSHGIVEGTSTQRGADRNTSSSRHSSTSRQSGRSRSMAAIALEMREAAFSVEAAIALMIEPHLSSYWDAADVWHRGIDPADRSLLYRRHWPRII